MPIGEFDVAAIVQSITQSGYRDIAGKITFHE
jgi:hypothetical protein